MPHDNKNPIAQCGSTTTIVVAQWLVVALPQNLVDALDRYAASLAPGTTAAEAARRILQKILLEQESSDGPVVLPHVS
jgi:hypothetical protein